MTDAKIFDMPAWSVTLDGPMRGSAAYDSKNVYIGTAAGTFYALDQLDGKTVWQYSTGSAIHSTAAYEEEKLYFTDNKQSLYCLSAKNGKLNWKIDFGDRLPYEWKYDYWYSSPVILQNKILVGADDGFMYCLDKENGKVIWKFKAESVIRATPTVESGVVYFGDCDGHVYAISLADGRPLWRFETEGVKFILGGEWYYDRKAVLGTVAISDSVCIVGARDGYLYGIHKTTGKKIWVENYDITWVCASVVVKDQIAIVGTSDGRFVRAHDVNTGKELWTTKTRGIVWSSAVIIGRTVYVSDGNSILYMLDYKTGEKISEYRTAALASCFSSPIFTGRAVVYGNDDGQVVSLEERPFDLTKSKSEKKYIFWQKDNPYNFRKGIDVKLRDYYNDNGYATIDSLTLISLISSPKPDSLILTFATNFFPDTLYAGGKNSVLRKYLDKGGRLILMSMNPVVYDTIYNFGRLKETLDLDYGPNDLRSFHGEYPAFANALGKKYQLPAFWVTHCSIKKNQVDTVLGDDENGLASAWIKYYGSNKKGAIIQVWVNQSKPTDINYLKYLKDIR